MMAPFCGLDLLRLPLIMTLGLKLTLIMPLF